MTHPHDIGTPNHLDYKELLELYRISAAMFDELIREKHRNVVNKTLQLIKESGYL